ncbi:hypothetical protein EJ419_06235 [Alloscardovia theropitheci]|uniref:AAA+ ATPase domain-containing protein n=1 Tax=Alloscardovia theropitheci TaxID=2496842 RepID=A0A4R0QUV3_9BIFI|nr:MobF family relaxase [Alloscardovia theropitheci]TCD53847.1 hypothetical protein EJ419_06235 [Alloscardovia theropitheci]
MSMSMKIIHAGYTKYLEESVSDSMRNLTTHGMSSYYTHEGNPPGYWMGSGLSMIGKHEGDIVGKGELFDVIERMNHPETHHKLASHISMRNADPRKPHSSSTVLGYDATFAAPKSFSVLWMIASEEQKRELDAMWKQSLSEAIGQFEHDAAYGRIGKGGVARTKLTGFTIAAYQHYTNRNGEPHYHTHAVISNLATREDGSIVALDGRTLLSVKEHINILHAQRLRSIMHENWGIEWTLTDSVSGDKTKVWEMRNMPREILEEVSTRRTHITNRLNELIEKYETTHGHTPTGRELKMLEQRAWNDTRHRKTQDTISVDTCVQRVQEIPQTRDIDASELVASQHGQDTQTYTYDHLDHTHILHLMTPLLEANLTDEAHASRSSNASENEVSQAFEHTVAANKTTFSLDHIIATAQTLTDGLNLKTVDDHVAIAHHITRECLTRFIPITPERYRIPDELVNDPRYTLTTSVGDHVSVLDMKKGTSLYASITLMDAEKNLLTLIDTTHDNGLLDRETVTDLLDQYNQQTRYPLSVDQYDAAVAALTTKRHIFSIIGAAGTGKTTTLKAMKYVIDHTLGEGHLIGSAPSTRAAEEMSESMNITCANIAAILTENTHHAVAKNIQRIEQQLSDPTVSIEEKKNLRAQLVRDRTQLAQYTIPDNSVLIVDEAGMASSTDLAKLSQLAADHNTRVIYTGDHMQLGAVGEGSGALYETYLQGKDHYAQLTTLFRFTDEHEAHITQDLRDGILSKDGTYSAIRDYRNMNRIHQSMSEDAMSEKAYSDTLTDLAHGYDVILMAADNDTVAHMNERFTLDLMAQGKVETNPALRTEFADGVSYGKGDHIITRKNTGRNITTSLGERVHNGDHWTITNVDIERQIVEVKNPQNEETARLPFWYVKQYAQGGYTSTIHLAQGATYDKARVIINTDSILNRASLYVAQTRGKTSNEIYVQLAPLADNDHANWVKTKASEQEKHGKKYWAYESTNPDPEKYYTDKDIEPTESELADAYLNQVCASTPTVLATRSRTQYNNQTHSISTLLAERQYLQNVLVEDDLIQAMTSLYSEHEIQAMKTQPGWSELITAYGKAYMIDPRQANQIITHRVKGHSDIKVSDADQHLFTTMHEGDTISVLTRSLNQISSPHHGTSRLGKYGYLTTYTPQHVTEKTPAQLHMLEQADKMLEEALDRQAAKSLSNPTAWQKVIQGKNSLPVVATRAYHTYMNLIKSVLIYRAEHSITNNFAPLGDRIKADVTPLLAAWRTNLTTQIYDYKNNQPTPPHTHRKTHMNTTTNTIYIAANPIQAQEYQEKHPHAHILTTTDSELTESLFTDTRSQENNETVTYTLITSGNREHDKEFLTNAYEHMTMQEKATATVVTRTNNQEETSPLWQALTDQMIPENLTRSNAVEYHHTIMDTIIDELPISMQTDSDQYVRHHITQIIKQHEEKQQYVQEQTQQRIQQQNYSASIE